MMSETHNGQNVTTRISYQRGISIWLGSVLVMIFCMVVIGGITRLTGSGLSMVEWRPLMGTLPPLSDSEWLRVFELYQASPQYQKVNQWMTITDFKWIFFWEYLHRLFGRLIGLVFALPWLYFTLRGALKGVWFWRSTAALILGGSQGLLGWYMVKSGLVDQPQVSHFRLAAHLSLAFFCGQWVWSMLLDLNLEKLHSYFHQNKDSSEESELGSLINTDRSSHTLKLMMNIQISFFITLVIQIIYGAFMAGSRAGYLYTTYPKMNGYWIAPTWYNETNDLIFPSMQSLLNSPDSIHFIHRTLAVVVLLLGAWLSLLIWRSFKGFLRQLGFYLGILLILQFLLGVFTVVSGMNITLAAMHQGGSFLLLSCALAVTQTSLRMRDKHSH